MVTIDKDPCGYAAKLLSDTVLNNQKVQNCDIDFSLFKLDYTHLQFNKKCLEVLLLAEQNGLCAYCQRKIDETTGSHIEHYVRQSIAPGMSLNYYNLFVSCNGNYIEKLSVETKENEIGEVVIKHRDKTCGKYKDNNKYNPPFLLLEKNADKYFTFTEKGDIVPRKGMKEVDNLEVDAVIKGFNLNYEKLKQARESFLTETNRFMFNMFPNGIKTDDDKAKATQEKRKAREKAYDGQFPGIVLYLTYE